MTPAPIDDLISDLLRETAGDRDEAPEYRREVSTTDHAQIRALYDEGFVTMPELAARFGLSVTKTWRVIQGRSGHR